jgi:hypothetical protein
MDLFGFFHLNMMRVHWVCCGEFEEASIFGALLRLSNPLFISCPILYLSLVQSLFVIERTRQLPRGKLLYVCDGSMARCNNKVI